MSRFVRGALAAPILAVAVLGTVAAQTGMASGSSVVALWHMNETSGTTMADSSGNGHTGTLHNVTLGATGVSGHAYTFNGRSSYVDVPHVSALNPGSANIDISFYLNTTSLPKSGDYDLVRKGAYPSRYYKVELLPTGQIKCSFRGRRSHSATGGSGLNNGAWHHVQCIKTGSQIETVIDGTVRATTNASVGSISNTYRVKIGAHPGSDWYRGELDEVSIAFG